MFLHGAAGRGAAEPRAHNPVFHRLAGILEVFAALAWGLMAAEIPADDLWESVFEAPSEHINRDMKGAIVKLDNGASVVIQDEHENADIIIVDQDGQLAVMTGKNLSITLVTLVAEGNEYLPQHGLAGDIGWANPLAAKAVIDATAGSRQPVHHFICMSKGIDEVKVQPSEMDHVLGRAWVSCRRWITREQSHRAYLMRERLAAVPCVITPGSRFATLANLSRPLQQGGQGNAPPPRSRRAPSRRSSERWRHGTTSSRTSSWPSARPIWPRGTAGSSRSWTTSSSASIPQSRRGSTWRARSASRTSRSR
jgi:hypothetical protein